MSDDLELEDEQHPAERRIQQKQETSAQRTLAIADAATSAGLTLNPDQRTALAALLGDDVTPDSVKAKAESLGIVTKQEEPVATGPSAEELQADAAALARMGEATATSTAPPAPPNALMDVRARMDTLGPSAFEVGGPLWRELMQAIPAAGLEFGTVENDGAFH